jgi:uncharacterized repeat protein (TIGR01451 family)
VHRGLALRSPPFFDMNTLTKPVIKCASLLAAGIVIPVASMPALAQAQVGPQIITNTAQVEWSSGADRLSKPSNTVAITVQQPPTPPSAVLTLLHFSSGPGATSQNLPQTQCVGSSGTRPITLQGAFSGYSTNPASLVEANSIRAGEPLVIKVDDNSKNLSSAAIDQFEATIQTPAGDSERIILVETSANSGQFLGLITTKASPPSPVSGDCVLSVNPGDKLTVKLDESSTGTSIGSSKVDVLIDPFGLTFDSADGKPVDGTKVTIIDTATGQPAQVFGDDAVSAFPSTITTGTPVTDSAGNSYNFPSGFYRFPFLRPGTYQLVITPPTPYTAPSAATPADISQLTRPDGGPFVITGASYGQPLTLNSPAPVRVDIPLDKPGGALTIRKTTSVANAMPGDVVQYRIEVRNADRVRRTTAVTVSDKLPDSMRLRNDSLRYQGLNIVPTVASDGRTFSALLPALGPSEAGTLTYLAEVRQDARPGDAINIAQARDTRGTVSDTVDANLRIIRDGISERFSLIGRVTEGGCIMDPRLAKGISGVRVMLEDGTYTVTDKDGRYHFEGLIPGTHVVQVDPNSFPLDQAPVDCARNTRSAGNAISRFVEGRGGMLKRADFRATQTEPRKPLVDHNTPLPTVMSDQQAAGADHDWFAGQTAGIGFVYPETGYNPRVRMIRAAVKHMADQKVELSLNGKRVSALNFDGSKKGPDGAFRVSVWRGLGIVDGNNILSARVLDSNGTLVKIVEQSVYFANAPMNAELVKANSTLFADGVTRPRIIVRLTDRNGKPIQHGSVGPFAVSAPYAPAVEVDAQQANQLSGLERSAPVWRVHGEDGLAYIELAPTSASGTVAINFEFQDGNARRSQRIEAWLEPGNQPWTVVGIAEGTIGFNRLNQHIETLDANEDKLNLDGRVALYAKGKISGKWLMTLAYDSDKKEAETRFAGVIDPRSYYTVYADRSEQRYDAASVRNLYLKLERPQFYALFGDYQTGIDEPELARYQRSFNGLKAEYHSDTIQAVAFAADTPYRHRHEEIQGSGLSGPYALGARDILANSEKIYLEARDRLRSDRIVDRKPLLRHIDYDVDYLAGTLRFREPILSRDSGLNPQFIIADYEVDGIGQRANNAGGHIRLTDKSGKVQVGATVVHDESDLDRTNLIGTNVKFTPAPGTEIRAEIAGSRSDAKTGSAVPSTGGALGWLVEAEHHNSNIDVIAYARDQEAGFGLGQSNRSEIGTRKYGLDARVRLNDKLSLSALGYQEEYHESGARRRAASAELEYRNDKSALRAGITHADDLLADGTHNVSTIAKLGGSQKLLNNKLELSAQTEFALGGQDSSIDFPARHSVSARYSIRNDIQLIGSYEIAKGENIDSRTARIGFDVAPWAGGRVTASANEQNIAEYGARSFAAYGLSQSFRISEKLSADFTLDGNKTLKGFSRTDVLNPLQPVASGGFLGSDSSLTEDFTAVTGGLTYRDDRWTWTGRTEYRAGETTDRYGVTVATLRQIGEGSAFGGAFSWFKANEKGGASTTTANGEISWAHRPADSQWSILNKIEYRYDAVSNAVLGERGPIGGAPLLIDGDASSRRIMNSLSINYTPVEKLNNHGDNFIERGEYGLFWGTRYNFDKFGAEDVEGWSNIVGADIKFDLDDIADLGASGTVRIGPNGKNIAYSGGPVLTVTPVENMNISIGYNIVGFADRDFEAERYTRSGPFVTLKLKFDQNSLAGFKF